MSAPARCECHVCEIKRERDEAIAAVEAWQQASAAEFAELTRERDEARAQVRAYVQWVNAISDALGDDPVDWGQSVQRILDLRRERYEARADLAQLRAWVRSMGLPALAELGETKEPKP